MVTAYLYMVTLLFRVLVLFLCACVCVCVFCCFVFSTFRRHLKPSHCSVSIGFIILPSISSLCVSTRNMSGKLLLWVELYATDYLLTCVCRIYVNHVALSVVSKH